MLKGDFTKSFDNCLMLPCLWDGVRRIRLGLLGGRLDNHETKINLNVLPACFNNVVLFWAMIALVEFCLGTHSTGMEDICARQLGDSIDILVKFGDKSFM